MTLPAQCIVHHLPTGITLLLVVILQGTQPSPCYIETTRGASFCCNIFFLRAEKLNVAWLFSLVFPLHGHTKTFITGDDNLFQGLRSSLDWLIVSFQEVDADWRCQEQTISTFSSVCTLAAAKMAQKMIFKFPTFVYQWTHLVRTWTSRTLQSLDNWRWHLSAFNSSPIGTWTFTLDKRCGWAQEMILSGHSMKLNYITLTFGYFTFFFFFWNKMDWTLAPTSTGHNEERHRLKELHRCKHSPVWIGMEKLVVETNLKNTEITPPFSMRNVCLCVPVVSPTRWPLILNLLSILLSRSSSTEMSLLNICVLPCFILYWIPQM